MSTVHSRQWFTEAFEVSQPRTDVAKRIAERICRSYNITGICDPAYIADVIDHEFCIGRWADAETRCKGTKQIGSNVYRCTRDAYHGDSCRFTEAAR